jgi:phosphohistidine phosphatase
MKTLVICRHAKSDWELGLPDIDRPLNARGQKDAPRMGQLLAKAGFDPDLIYSSPAVRARTTAEFVAKALDHTKPLHLDERLYEQGHGQMLSVLQGTPREAETIMVFAHNPTLELLAAFLQQSQGGVILPTAAMLALEFQINDWKDLGTRAGALKWLLIPKLVLL